MQVGKLTPEQKDLLVGQLYNQDSYFYPVIDANDNWVIGIQEINSNVFEWLKELPLIEFQQKITSDLID